MNKLLVALCASTFALVSSSTIAEDSSLTPLSNMHTWQARAAMKATQEKWAKMTPAERVAATREAAKKKEAAQTALDRIALTPWRWTVEDAHRVDKELSTKHPYPAEQQ